MHLQHDLRFRPDSVPHRLHERDRAELLATLQLVMAGPERVELQGPVSPLGDLLDRKSTRLNSSHANISYAVFCLKKKKNYRIKSYLNINTRDGVEGTRGYPPVISYITSLLVSQ